MAKVIINPTPTAGKEYIFYCPGCKAEHWFRVDGPEPVWSFNGDVDSPTITPSLSVSSQHLCHSFITHGKLLFLQDCTHDLAGKTVKIPEYNEGDL